MACWNIDHISIMVQTNKQQTSLAFYPPPQFLDSPMQTMYSNFKYRKMPLKHDQIKFEPKELIWVFWPWPLVINDLKFHIFSLDLDPGGYFLIYWDRRTFWRFFLSKEHEKFFLRILFICHFDNITNIITVCTWIMNVIFFFQCMVNLLTYICNTKGKKSMTLSQIVLSKSTSSASIK